MTTRDNIEAVYPLTPLQLGMLFHTICRPELNLYFEQISGEIVGALHLDAFEAAWQHVTDRHDVLRTAFAWVDLEEPLQVVGRRVRFPFEVHDGTGAAASFRDFLDGDKRRGFQLTKAPLMRIQLLRTSPTLHRFVWSHHHLILDGWSWPVLLREVFESYAARLEARAPVLPPAHSFRTFVDWVRRQDLNAAEAHWRRSLRGFIRPTHILLDRGAGALEGDHEERVRPLRLALGLSIRLRALSRQAGVTMYTIVQGALALLLARHSGTRDVVFGSTTALRPPQLADVESRVGLFINVVPVRVAIPDDVSIGDWLCAIQADQLRARAHHWAPLAQVTRWSDLPQGAGLFDCMLSFQNYPMLSATSFDRCGLAVRNVSWTGPTNYAFVVRGTAGRDLDLALGYHPSRYSDDDIAGLARDLEEILAGLAGGPGARLAGIHAAAAPEPAPTAALRGERFDFE